MTKKRADYTTEELAELTVAELEQLLTDKQQLFVRQYCLDHNGTQAAIRAGYRAGKENHAAATQAARLLKDPAVHAYLLAVKRETFNQLGITLESLCTDLLDIRDKCMQVTPVVEWDKVAHAYRETGEYQFDAKGAIRATELLAELLGVKERRGDGATIRVELDKELAQ
ncbi:MAG: terminase small subunit [Oscillospiraceae bacterium]|nr:terminase small subunit [Oscillospiraceae bacterium]